MTGNSFVMKVGAQILAHAVKTGRTLTAYEVGEKLFPREPHDVSEARAKYALQKLAGLGFLKKEVKLMNSKAYKTKTRSHVLYSLAQKAFSLDGLTFVRAGGGLFMQGCPYPDCACATKGFGPACKTWQEMRANIIPITQEFMKNVADLLDYDVKGRITFTVNPDCKACGKPPSKSNKVVETSKGVFIHEKCMTPH